MAEVQPIIKKVKKSKGHGHHGGAWKLAYADFVTAMMAFFLLMWLLGSTTKEMRKGIADYFSDPWKASLSGGQSVGDRTSIIQGGGSDLTNQESGQVDRGQRPKDEDVPPVDMAELNQKQVELAAEQFEKQQLENLKETIEKMIEAKPEMNEYKEQIKLEITPEGLRVLIIDSLNRPMFRLASSEAAPHIRLILKNLAGVINSLPNKISLNGHTDSLPFPGNQTGYSNWELSSDRANAARRELVKAGVAEDKILRVVGLASSIPYNTTDPADPINRRISIVVMNKKSEQEIVQDAGSFSGGATPSTPAITPAEPAKSSEGPIKIDLTPSIATGPSH